LLLAVQLTINYISNTKTPQDKVKFQRLAQGSGIKAKSNRILLIKNMISQMRKYRISYPMNEKIYSVEEHVPLVQKLLDLQYPGEYRLDIFREFGKTKPAWKSKDRARNDLCLYLKDGHFYGIRKINTFFGTNYYCLDCEVTYKFKKVTVQNAYQNVLDVAVWE